MKVINPCWGRYPRYKITRSIRYCSWSNLCPVPCTSCGGRGGPAITDTKRTIIVRRLIQSVVSVISRVWFIWDRTRGRIIRIPRSHHGNKPKNFLAKLVSSSYRYLYLHNGTGTEKFLLAREGWKVWPFFLEGEWSIGGNRSVERIGGYVREKGMVERRRQRGARVFREHALPGVTKCLEGWDEISRGWRGSIPAFLLLALNFWCAPRLEYAAGERAGKEE